MLGLESEHMPLRTLDRFYDPPIRSRSGQGIKIFPAAKAHNQDLLTPKGQLPSILSYLSGLKGARSLPRRVISSKDYYEPQIGCSKVSRSRANPQNASLNGSMSRSFRLDTILSSNAGNQNAHQVLNRKRRQERSFRGERQKLRKEVESLQKTEMRLSFYNTIEKSSYFVDRFREDSFLKVRRTSNYQNMMGRSITTDNILGILARHRQGIK